MPKILLSATIHMEVSLFAPAFHFLIELCKRKTINSDILIYLWQITCMFHISNYIIHWELKYVGMASIFLHRCAWTFLIWVCSNQHIHQLEARCLHTWAMDWSSCRNNNVCWQNYKGVIVEQTAATSYSSVTWPCQVNRFN